MILGFSSRLWPQWGVAVLTVLVSALAHGEHHQCSQRSLRIKNCHLKHYGYHIHFTESERIIISDGIWREVEDMPLKGDAVLWEKIWMERIQGRTFVSVMQWTAPKGEGEVRSLQWVVLELDGSKVKKQLTQTVQKLRVSLNNREPAQYKDDRKPYGLSPGEGDKIYWWNGHHIGHF